MNTVPLMIFFAFIAVFLLVILISILVFDKKNPQNTLRKLKEEDTWLFDHFNDHVYEIFFGDRDPVDIATSVGIKTEEYYNNCAITRKTPDVKRLIINFVYSLLCAALGIVLYVVFKDIIVLLVGLLMFSILAYLEQYTVRKKAKKKKNQIFNELPRFLDLLQSELMIGMPIETAIMKLAERMDDTLLGREFLDAFNKTELGAGNWQKAISDTALKYDVDTLTDFCMNVITAYDRGISIVEVVIQKNKDIRKEHVLAIKEKCGKVSNIELIPITIFQLVPMLAFILVPTIIQIVNGL